MKKNIINEKIKKLNNIAEMIEKEMKYVTLDNLDLTNRRISILMAQKKFIVYSLIKNTTFKKEEFLEFLVKYLSINEQQEYILIPNISFVSEDILNQCLKTENYNLIIEKEDYEKTIGNSDFTNKFILNLLQNPYILLKDDEKYSFFSECGLGINMREEFQKFPYLFNIAQRIYNEKENYLNEKNENLLRAELNKAVTANKLFGSIDKNNDLNKKKEITLKINKK